MLFLLATPEYQNTQFNITKVRVHLRNGVAEIYERHQDLMGKVENNVLEIESTTENKVEKFLFVLQDAVFIVSNKGLDVEDNSNQTSVYVYAKQAKEIGPTTSIDEISKQYEQKKLELDAFLQKYSTKEADQYEKVISSKILLIQEEIDFLKKSLTVLKDKKNS